MYIHELDDKTNNEYIIQAFQAKHPPINAQFLCHALTGEHPNKLDITPKQYVEKPIVVVTWLTGLSKTHN